jgi:hypothetical protein
MRFMIKEAYGKAKGQYSRKILCTISTLVEMLIFIYILTSDPEFASKW